MCVMPNAQVTRHLLSSVVCRLSSSLRESSRPLGLGQGFVHEALVVGCIERATDNAAGGEKGQAGYLALKLLFGPARIRLDLLVGLDEQAVALLASLKLGRRDGLLALLVGLRQHLT